MDIMIVYQKINGVLDFLKDKRKDVEKSFKNIYEHADSMVKAADIDLSMPRICARQTM